MEELEKGFEDLVVGILDTYRVEETPKMAALSEEAFALLDAFYREITARRNSDLVDVDEFAARWGEQANRIALVLHLMRHGSRRPPGDGARR